MNAQDEYWNIYTEAKSKNTENFVNSFIKLYKICFEKKLVFGFKSFH